MRTIRSARVEDVPALLEIYAPHILKTAVSFETEVPSVGEMEKRLREISAKFPWLVCEENGVVAGYAYATTFRVRAAYDWSAEATVYVRAGHERTGLGRALYAALFEKLARQGIVNIIGGITLPNEGSVRLHESMGFKPVARLPGIGFKFGQWWDVGYWQLELTRPARPEPLGKP